MQRLAPVDERRAGERRAAVVEGGRRPLAADGVDLTGDGHVERLDEGRRRLVGHVGVREERGVQGDDLLRLLDDAKLARPPEDDRLRDIFDCLYHVKGLSNEIRQVFMMTGFLQLFEIK